MKHVQGLLGYGKRSYKIIPMSIEACISTHQLVGPLCKELPELLLEMLHHCGLDTFDLNLRAIIALLRKPNAWKSQWCRAWAVRRMV